MMAANYRHIGDRENRLGRHYSRFSPFWPTPALAGQSLALRKLCDAGSNRRSQVNGVFDGVHLSSMPPTVALAPVQSTHVTGAFARHISCSGFRGTCNSTV